MEKPQKGMKDWLIRGRSLLQTGTLSYKIVLGVLPAVLAITAMMGVFSYSMARRQILKGVKAEVDTLAQQAALRLQTAFQQCRNDVEALSETPLIRDYMKNISFDLAQEAEVCRWEMDRYFSNFAARSKVYHNIRFIRADGRQICSLIPGETADNAFSTAFLQRLARQRRFETTRQYKNVFVRCYAKAVFDEFGGFLGAVVLDFDLNHVSEILRHLPTSRNGHAFVEDMSGKLVLGSRPQMESPLIGLSDVSGIAWRVGVIAPEDDFLAPLKKIRDITMFLSVLACFVVAILIATRVSSLLKPLHDMARGTERFAAGDLAHRFERPAATELNILASSFNRMADSLQERTQQLEQRLRQQTALREMDEAVIQRLDEDEILRTCLQAVVRGFSFDRAGLYWVDHGAKQIFGRAIYGPLGTVLDEESFRSRRIPMEDDEILTQVVRDRESLLIKNPEDDRRLNPVFMQETKTREFILAPIRGKDRVLGVLAADNYHTQRPLEESDREGLTLFSDAVGLALENARLFQNLARSEARYRTVLENSPVAVIGVSKEHRITTWSRGAEIIFGYRTEEIEGKPLTVLFPPDSEEKYRSLLAHVMEKGFVHDYSMPGYTRDKRSRELSLSWGGAFHDFWMNTEWTVVILDVTQSRQLQQKLIQSEKHAAVGQLISSIAHELNNPLTAVVGYAQLLSNEMKENAAVVFGSTAGSFANFWDGLRGDLGQIWEGAHRCRKIIENLLLFVRRGGVEKKPMSLDRAVRAALELLEYKLKKSANINVILDFPASLPLIRGNFQQVQQVFINLINNACDAMSQPADLKEIRIQARVVTDFVRVELSDVGSGIPAEVQKHLFEPFFTTKPEGRGTGLGLAVCRQIVEEHGGRIGFQSEDGRGTTFRMEFQVARGKEVEPVKVAEPIPKIAGKNVLLVEDEPAVRSFLKKILEQDGLAVVAASSYREGLTGVVRHPYDLVIADVQLGEGTGIDLYESWGQMLSFPRPQFLFITGDVLNSNLKQLLDEAHLPVLYKPIEIDAFLQMVRSLLSVNHEGRSSAQSITRKRNK